MEIDSVRMTLTLPQEKFEKMRLKCQKLISNPRTKLGSDKPCRFSLLNCTGSASSYAAIQVFTTTANSNYKKQSLLPVCNVSEPGFYSGTEVVVQQPGDLQWQTSCASNL